MPSRENRRDQFAPGSRRSVGSLNRVSGTRPGDRILIVCEGRKTERIYFESLRSTYRLSAVEVEVIGLAAAPITVVNAALELRKEQARKARSGSGTSFDAVWCVFDTEIPHNNPSLPQAIDKAKANGLSLAISNPSFEYWYLLHFVFTDRAFYNSDEVCEELRNHITNYDKATDYREVLLPHTATAISRAKSIPDPDDIFPQPSTRVYQVVEKLRRMKRE